MQPELRDYIIQSRQQGVGDEAIREALVAAGWKSLLVDQALRQDLQPQPDTNESEKEYFATVLLSAFAGIFAADRFYLGKTPTAIAKLLTIGGLGIWAIIDVWLTVFGGVKDKDKKPLRNYKRDSRRVKAIFLIVVIFHTFVVLPYTVLSFGLSFYDGMQQTSRDIDRRADLEAMQMLLEDYNNRTGKYPTLAEINDTSFRQDNLRAYNEQIFSSDGEGDTKLGAVKDPNTYGYQALSADGKECDNQTVNCVTYTLTAPEELQPGQYIIRTNLRAI